MPGREEGREMTDVFVVMAHRWGDPELHSYVVGVFSTREAAEYAFETEEIDRGGKYGCSIRRFDLGKPGSEMVRKAERIEGGKSAAHQVMEAMETKKQLASLRAKVRDWCNRWISLAVGSDDDRVKMYDEMREEASKC